MECPFVVKDEDWLGLGISTDELVYCDPNAHAELLTANYKSVILLSKLCFSRRRTSSLAIFYASTQSPGHWFYFQTIG